MVYNPLPHKSTPFIDVYMVVLMYILYCEYTNSSIPRDISTLKTNILIGNDFILFKFKNKCMTGKKEGSNVIQKEQCNAFNGLVSK